MLRFVPALLAVTLVSGAHATPAQVQIKITEVLLPAGLPATFTQSKDPATGTPDDLLALQLAAARAKVILTITPGPSLTTTDGVAGAFNTDTTLPFTATDARGKKQKAFQTLVNGMSALPHVNPDGTITVKLSVTGSKVTGPPTTPGGPLPIMTQSFNTLRTFTNGQTENIGGFDIKAHSSRLVFATVTLVPPAKP